MRSLILRLISQTLLLSTSAGIWENSLVAQTARDVETAAVYRAALDALFQSTEKPGVILVTDSVLRYTGDGSWISAQIPIDYTSGPMKARFPADLAYPIPVVRLSASELDALLAVGRAMLDSQGRTGKPAPDQFWLTLARRYPAAWGRTSFSEVVFNETLERAVLWAHHGCGGCQHSETMLLEKEAGRWRVADRLVRAGDARDGIGPGNMRHLWVDARMRVDSLIAAHRKEVHEAESLRRDSMPRRWRGVIVNKVTGTPTSNAAPFLHVPPDTVPRLLPLVRPGEFELVNYPIGGALLVVQCAGFAANHDNPIAVTNIRIEPAQDTTVQIEAGPMSACWPSRRAGRLVAGELASERFLKSPLPSPEEAPIYRAVLRELMCGDDWSSILLRPTLGKPCEHADWVCGVPELAVLEREGAAGAGSIGGLMKRAASPHPFNVAFARNVGVSLLTDGEAAYLMKERQAANPNRMYPEDPSSYLVKAAIEAYPRARGITSLSAISYDETRRRAIVQVRTERPDSLNAIRTMIIAREGDDWKIAHPHVENVLLSGAYAGNACIPSRARVSPSRSQVLELSGRYAFDIVSATGVNSGLRRLHLSFRPRGNDSSGVRLTPLFEVFDAATGKRDDATESGMFLTSGPYELQRSNRATRLHGEGYQLEILDARGDAIFGSWRYFRGQFYDTTRDRLADPAGFFCARKLTPGNREQKSIALRLQ